MAEYLKLFQDITTSVDSLISSSSSSQEIQGFATRLKQSIQPCFNELERSAGILKELLQPCFDELAHAEAEWQEKPSVTQASGTDIREQMGCFVGYLFKLRLLKSQLISQVLEQAQSSWQQRVDQLKVKWFIDPKNNSLKSVNPLEKEKLIQAIRFELHPQSTEISSLLTHVLEPIQAQLQQMQFSNVANHLNLLTERERLNYSSLLQSLDLPNLQSKVKEPLLHLPAGTPNFFDAVNPLVENLIDQGFLVANLPGKAAIKSFIGNGILPLTWENFSQFAQDVHLAIKQLINTVIEDVIQSIATLLEQSVDFYDRFLEKQQRYQQETMDQRQSERTWLLTRRQSLEKIRNDVDLVLSSLTRP